MSIWNSAIKRLVVFLIVFGLPAQSLAKQKLILASTTSTQDSGLLDVLIPAFEERYHCQVKLIAVGTGQAIRLAIDGNADVLLVHDPNSEQRFVADGYGLKRLAVMHNDFVLLGPKDDPAGIKGSLALDAFKRIWTSKAGFTSRGDNSGTHKKELSLWKQLNIVPAGDWYLESGSGMEMTLRIANEKRTYILCDRSTYLFHKREIDTLEILSQGDPILFNPYSIIVVSPAKFPWVNFKLAQMFAEFIRGQEGQKIIKNYGLKRFGEPLFFPDVVKYRVTIQHRHRGY